MGQAAFLSPTLPIKIAVLVVRHSSKSLLCPFFDKCDGVVLFNSIDGSNKYFPCDHSTAKPAYDLILQLQPQQLICGFIGGPEREMLFAAGIDVRLGSCSCSVDELVSSFSTLPKA